MSNYEKLRDIINKIRERSDINLKEYEEILEYSVEEFVRKNFSTELQSLTLNVEEPLSVSKTLVGDIIYLLVLRFGLKIGFENFESTNDFFSKITIELCLGELNNNKTDIVETLSTAIIDNLWQVDIDSDKLDKIYLHKELTQFILSRYSDLDLILKSIREENPILSTIFKKYSKQLFVPVKWIKLEPSKLFKPRNVFNAEYLITYVLGDKNETTS